VADVKVDAFSFDDDNLDELTAHGLTPRQVAQVLDDEFFVTRNKRRRRASHLVIGYDYGGRCLTIPIEPTPDPTTWRPVTGWRSTPAERGRRDRARRRPRR
jgi:hypothetical protein